MADVTKMPFEDRLGEVFELTAQKVGPEAARQLRAIISPESLAIIAGVLIAWVVSHAFGIGEIIDIVIVVVGVFAIGLAVFSGLDHLYEFASGTYNAKTTKDLEIAADHLAKAIAILGIQAVLAVLFRGAPKPGRGKPINIGKAPVRNGPIRYKPTIKADPTLPAGHGGTSFWGNIRVSTKGAANDRNVVLLHEKVHQFLMPKLYLLRNFRVQNRMNSYFKSSLWRYIEEALAETIALVGVRGFRQFFTGIRFPVKSGYVYLTKSGGYSPHMAGGGLIPEGAGLLASGMVAGMQFNLWFSTK